jgi:ELWxxDGT repeat protein
MVTLTEDGLLLFLKLNFTMKSKILHLIISMFFVASLHAQITLVKEAEVLNGWSYLAAAGDYMFFAASDPDHGYEPWVSDGTPGGTHLLKDINSGTVGGMFFGNTYAQEHCHIVFNGEYYFIADDGLHGMEVWKTDGTEEGTIMLKDIHPFGGMLGNSFNDYPYFCIVNGILFFEADDNAHGSELWKTDGTTDGTSLVKDIYTDYYGSEPFGLTAFNGEVYFRAWGLTGGRELWKSDGTLDGTVMVKDILPGQYGAFSALESSLDPNFVVSGNYLFFRANTDSASVDVHLWRTDGTELETIQLEDQLVEGYLYDTGNLGADVDGTFYFIATDNTPSYLWKSDGTPSGTVNVPTNNSLSVTRELFSYNDILVFDGHDNSGHGLCRSDGTTPGSYMVKTFPGLGSNSEVRGMATGDSNLFGGVLTAINETSMEWRIFQSNGTTSGTTLFPHYGYLGGLTSFNDKMYYGGYDTTINSSYTVLGLYELTPIALGVSEFLEKEKFQVFPNPANDAITIKLDSKGNLGNTRIEIVNVLGETVKAISVNENRETRIQVGDIPSGIYQCRLMRDEKTITSEKILISR